MRRKLDDNVSQVQHVTFIRIAYVLIGRVPVAAIIVPVASGLYAFHNFVTVGFSLMADPLTSSATPTFVPTQRTSLSDSLVSYQTVRALAGHLAAIDQAMERSNASVNSDAESSVEPLDDEFSTDSAGAADDVIDSA